MFGKRSQYILASISLAAALGVASPAAAEELANPESVKELALAVVFAENPEAALADLQPSQQEAVIAAIEDNLTSSAPEETSTASVLPLQEVADIGLANSTALPAAAAVKKCWYHLYESGWTLWGLEVGWSDMRLNWCGKSKKIVSSSISYGGGATGLGYEKAGKTKNDVGWEVRARTQHKFTMGPLNVTKCMQIRGGATGLYSRSVSCSLS